MFLCSDRAIDQLMLEEAGVSHVALPARPFSARPIPLLRFLSAWRSTRREARPLVMASQRLVSLGGFVAPPVAREARAQGVPITLLNLDARIGKATRHIIPIADDIVTAVPAELPGNPEPIGVPLRKAVFSDGDQAAARLRLGLDPNRSTLLITGASQGAASLNRGMFRQQADLMVANLLSAPRPIKSRACRSNRTKNLSRIAEEEAAGLFRH